MALLASHVSGAAVVGGPVDAAITGRAWFFSNGGGVRGAVGTGRGQVQVSVVIVARDASDTLGDALASLERQEMASWEAIVVDDGSTDGTAEVAAKFAASDPRIRVVRAPRLGVSAARNRGVVAAASEWLLFLDADDALDPGALSALLHAADADRSVGAVLGGWARLSADGVYVDEAEPEQAGDLFDVLARRSAFPVNACLVRRVLVLAAGGWDVTLARFEDWDLWQRVARTGARFGVAPGRVALHRARGADPLNDTSRLLDEGVRVVLRGHGSDRRVYAPSPRHVRGRAADPTPSLYRFTCWCAGQLLAGGGDAASALVTMGNVPHPELEPDAVAEALLLGARTGAPELAGRPVALWDRIRPRLSSYLKGLEATSGAPSLAALATVSLERAFIDSWSTRPLGVGGTLAMSVEVTRPVPEVRTQVCSRLVCDVLVEGEKLGRVELPVVDGLVPGPVLQDAIAAEFVNPLIDRFFTRGAYPERGIDEARRGDARWAVLLQELFDRKDWTLEAFLDPDRIESRPAPAETHDESPRIELGHDVPDLRAERVTNVVVMVGGVILGRVEVQPVAGVITAQRLRSALIQSAGPELCVACVREGLIGRPFTAAPSLRARVAEASRVRASRRGAEWPAIADGGLLVLGRRATRAIGTSASRRAALPAAAVKELEAAAASANEPFAKLPPDAECIDRVVHAPDVLCDGRASRVVSARVASVGRRTAPREATDQLPILVYHRVSEHGWEPTERQRVTPSAFEAQLRYLRGAGYHSITLDDWLAAMRTRTPVPGRAVILTFDAGYLDFHTTAWPILRDYDFGATVFLVASMIGRSSVWERGRGVEAPLMDWQRIRALRDEGVDFGSLTASHATLAALSHADVVRELTWSRALLERGIERSVDAVAYPYDRWDSSIAHLAGACGYVYGLTGRGGRSRLSDSALRLPRIEIRGEDSLADFSRKLFGGPQ